MELKEYLSSKKTKDMLVGVVAVIMADKLGVSPETLYMVSGLVGIKVLGQSAVDCNIAKASIRG